MFLRSGSAENLYSLLNLCKEGTDLCSEAASGGDLLSMNEDLGSIPSANIHTYIHINIHMHIYSCTYNLITVLMEV